MTSRTPGTSSSDFTPHTQRREEGPCAHNYDKEGAKEVLPFHPSPPKTSIRSKCPLVEDVGFCSVISRVCGFKSSKDVTMHKWFRRRRKRINIWAMYERRGADGHYFIITYHIDVLRHWYVVILIWEEDLSSPCTLVSYGVERWFFKKTKKRSVQNITKRLSSNKWQHEREKETSEWGGDEIKSFTLWFYGSRELGCTQAINNNGSRIFAFYNAF